MKFVNLLLCVASMLPLTPLSAQQNDDNDSYSIASTKQKQRLRVLFIGDSITDGGWGRSGGSMKATADRNQNDLNHIYGHSYVMLCAARCQSDYPDADFQFFNRGISGDRLSELEARWQDDAINIHADVVTILVGTNDVEQFLNQSTDSEFDFSGWDARYRALLDALRLDNPEVKIVLATPFVAKVGRRGNADNYPRRVELIDGCSNVVKAIASDYNAICLPFNTMFSTLQSTAPRPDYWIWDSIHPTAAGHQRMADSWLNAVLPILLK